MALMEKSIWVPKNFEIIWLQLYRALNGQSTPRQSQVAALLCKNLSVMDVSRGLGMKEKTVYNTAISLSKKLGYVNHKQMVIDFKFKYSEIVA